MKAAADANRAAAKNFSGKAKPTGYERYLPEIDSHFWIAIAVIIVGAALMLGIELLGKDKEKT